ncbi:copper chaperone PCu(A)C [Paracoccus aeridis]|uniref:copper chaperone PCu(A)C n=1 Tax=Paracoccus aeridis TaxID=1966466 RepID=UPI00191C3F52|nr:copper chaperone PCu(A)C [Paracoccus aeridis]
MKLPVAAVLAFALSAGFVQAEPVRQGDLEIDAAWARASIGSSRPGAAYFTVRNLGDEADRLTGLSSPVSAMPMLHETTLSEGISRMAHVEAAEIPAGGELTLEPGGMHVMLMELTTPLKEGATFPLTLTFEAGGEITVEMPVFGPGATGPAE